MGSSRRLFPEPGQFGKKPISISGDGKVIVYASELDPKQWFSVRIDGDRGVELGPVEGNAARPALNYDGSQMFHFHPRISGGSLIATDSPAGKM